MQAGAAKDALQGFKITPTNAMKISFAKKWGTCPGVWENCRLCYSSGFHLPIRMSVWSERCKLNLMLSVMGGKDYYYYFKTEKVGSISLPAATDALHWGRALLALHSVGSGSALQPCKSGNLVCYVFMPIKITHKPLGFVSFYIILLLGMHRLKKSSGILVCPLQAWLKTAHHYSI